MTDTELPKGWAVATLGEVCAQSGRKSSREEADCPPRFLGLDDIAPDSGRIISHHLSSEISGSGSVASSGDILYCRLRPYLNKVAVAEGDYLCSGELLVFCADDDITGSYLAHWLRSDAFVSFAIQNSKGDRPRVYWTEIAASSIPLPPGNEQRRIVNELERRLSHVDAAVSALHSALRRTTLLRHSIVWSSVLPNPGGGVDEEGRPNLPDDWEWTTLGKVADVVGGVTKDSKKQSDPSFVEVRYLRVANVQRGFLKLDEVALIRVHPDKAKALYLESGDILFNEGGDRDKLGRGWVWEGQVPNCIHQNHVFRARLSEERLSPKFVSWIGNSFGQRWFEKAGKQTTNLASINKKTLEAFPVPLPPAGVATRVVADVERRLSLVDAAEHAIKVNLKRAEQLRRSLLVTAFSGKFVPQDPDDEPADALLERIRLQREASRTETAMQGKANARKKKELSR